MARTSTRNAVQETAPDAETPDVDTTKPDNDTTGTPDGNHPAPADEWADLAVETAPADVPAVPFVPVPDTILALAKKAMADGSQMVRIEGMNEDRVKKLVAHIRNTKGHFPEIARVRTVPVKYRGETALKVTISKVTSTANDQTTQPETETETS